MQRANKIAAIATSVTLMLAAHSRASEYTPGTDWQSYNKTLQGLRFSALAEINASNAKGLTEKCRAPIAEHGSFQAGLVMVNDTLFATTATDTIALDAGTCVVKWRHRYQREQPGSPMAANRGVAYLNGRVFRGTDDARVIALDAATGQEVWRSVAGDASLGECVTGAPIAWNGLVIVGTAVGEYGVRGRIIAYDAASGKELWRFNTIPVGSETGARSWKNTDWARHGGGGTWSTFAIDPVSAELFVPVGNPVPDFSPGLRPGSNLFTNSVVVLDAISGRLKWWYQLNSLDAYDHDLGAAPVLYRDSSNEERVAVAGKDGYLHIVSRATHQLMHRVAVTTIDPVPALPTAAGVRVCPGVLGGVGWNGPAFDPLQRSLFVGSIDYCTIYRSESNTRWQPGVPNVGGTIGVPMEVPSGWIVAVDADSGAVRWKFHAEAPIISALTPTAGGIVLAGDNAGTFLVLDSRTGRVLHQVATGGALAGGIITYEHSGAQMIAMTSGSSSRTFFGVVGRPTIIVMSLPESQAAAASTFERGKAEYLQTCAICHGSDGKNLSGFDLSVIASRMSVQDIVAWVTHPQPPMPKMFSDPLSDDDLATVTAIATYLHDRPVAADAP